MGRGMIRSLVRGRRQDRGGAIMLRPRFSGKAEAAL
jgi:hypothetical protein